MSYLNSFRVNGTNYQLRDEEALHDGSVFATKQDLGNYALKGEVSNVNCFIDGSTLVFELGGNGGGDFHPFYLKVEEFNGRELSLSPGTGVWMFSENTNITDYTMTTAGENANVVGRYGNGELPFPFNGTASDNVPNEAVIWSVSGPLGDYNMTVNGANGTTWSFTIHIVEGGGSEGPNFTDVYTTNITNIVNNSGTVVLTAADSGFTELQNAISSYGLEHWNAAFRTADGSQHGYGEFALEQIEAGYRSSDNTLEFHTSDNTIHFTGNTTSEITNAATFVLQRVAN